MKQFVIFGLMFLFVGCGQKEKGALIIQEQGSFAVGGTILTDSVGHTFHGDHAYVFYQKPMNARTYPLVFAHGVGQFSKTWETTPDGREGFQNLFYVGVIVLMSLINPVVGMQVAVQIW